MDRAPLAAEERQPDISLASEKLGWTPKVPLDDGLESTIAYFDRLLSGTVKDLRLATA
jgi:nucleoside-diphosphate-sugar epimerase